MICYKVLQVGYNYKLISSNILREDHQKYPHLSLIYTPGEITRPKVEGTQLFVFQFEHHAKKFADSYEKVWKCECPELTPFFGGNIDNSLDALVKFWANPDKYDKFDFTGSCVTPYLTLLEEVK